MTTESKHTKSLTARRADRFINTGERVSLYNVLYKERFSGTIVSRDRRTITMDNGGKFHRDELVIVADR